MFRVSLALFLAALVAIDGGAWAKLGSEVEIKLNEELRSIELARQEARGAVIAWRNSKWYNGLKLNELCDMFLASCDLAYQPMVEAINKLKRGELDAPAKSYRDILGELYGQVLQAGLTHKQRMLDVAAILDRETGKNRLKLVLDRTLWSMTNKYLNFNPSTSSKGI